MGSPPFQFRFTQQAGFVRLATSGFAAGVVMALGRGRLPHVSLHGMGWLGPLVLVLAALAWLAFSKRHTWTIEAAIRALRVEEKTLLWTVTRMVPLAGLSAVSVVPDRWAPGLMLTYVDGRKVQLTTAPGREAELEVFADGLRSTIPPPMASTG